MDYELTAFDHELLRQFKGTEVRKTFYELSLKVSFDDTVLEERLVKLEKLGYVKSYTRNGKRVYRRL